MADPSIVRVKRTFAYSDKDGNPQVVRKGTTVRVGHPMIKGREDHFEPAEVQMEHKPTTTRK